MLLAEEFIRGIVTADFLSLVGRENAEEFVKYCEECERNKQGVLAFRFLFQRPNDDGVPTPYYVWALYHLDGDDEVELINPDFTNYETYLATPEEVKGLFVWNVKGEWGGLK